MPAIYIYEVSRECQMFHISFIPSLVANRKTVINFGSLLFDHNDLSFRILLRQPKGCKGRHPARTRPQLCSP